MIWQAFARGCNVWEYIMWFHIFALTFDVCILITQNSWICHCVSVSAKISIFLLLLITWGGNKLILWAVKLKHWAERWFNPPWSWGQLQSQVMGVFGTLCNNIIEGRRQSKVNAGMRLENRFQVVQSIGIMCLWAYWFFLSMRACFSYNYTLRNNDVKHLFLCCWRLAIKS